jgi:hypothetical protein
MRLKILVFILAVCVCSLLGPIYPAHADDNPWGPPDPDYAILPGVGIGAIALGMPEKLAARASARYGKVSYAAVSRRYDAGHLRFWIGDDGKVRNVFAWGDSRFYIVVPGGPSEYLHELSANTDSLLASLGYPCDEYLNPLFFGSALRDTYEPMGIDVDRVEGGLVASALVYPVEMLTLDEMREATCGEP